MSQINLNVVWMNQKTIKRREKITNQRRLKKVIMISVVLVLHHGHHMGKVWSNKKRTGLHGFLW